MKALAFVVLLAGLAVGCQSERAPRTPLFGTPGSGKMRVTIGGYVAWPGDYFIDAGTRLDAVPAALFGGFRICDHCGVSAKYVVVYAHDHPKEMRKVLLTRTEELHKVKLADGDKITYAAVHF